jgi:hypothetical protein
VFGAALFGAAAPRSVDCATDGLGGAATDITTLTMSAPNTSRIFMLASVPVGRLKGRQPMGTPYRRLAARTSGILCRDRRQKLRIAALVRRQVREENP